MFQEFALSANQVAPIPDLSSLDDMALKRTAAQMGSPCLRRGASISNSVLAMGDGGMGSAANAAWFMLQAIIRNAAAMVSE